MEREKFEESFREAFTGAEITPSDAVWTNVELVLEKNSGGKMKGRLLFFQLLAAASMVFAMGVGSVYFLGVQNNNQIQTLSQAETDSQKREAFKAPSISGNVTNEKNITNNNENKDQQNAESKRDRNSGTNTVISKNQTSSHTSFEEDPGVRVSSQENVNSQITTRSLPKLVNVTNPVYKSSQPEADAGMIMLAKLRDEEKKYESKKSDKSKNENLWTSVGMSAGTFNPNASSPAVASAAAFGPSVVSSSPSAGSSYSVGINVGGRVSERIIIQGGVSYLSQNAEYTSSTTQGDMAALNEFASVKSEASDGINKMSATSPYQVNSNLQYVSLPIQAGYIILDKAFAIQINGGLATDIFIQNTLKAENNDFRDATQGAGSDSPYRTLNFSGLVGTELSYRIGTHYRIAVNPGLRYALNSIYKTEVATQVSPITYDVGLRFRYIFN